MPRWKFPSPKMAIDQAVYDVRVIPHLEKNVAEVEFDERLIVVTPVKQKHLAATLLLHEWIHAQLHERGVKGLPQKQEEAICDNLAVAVLQLFRDNPEWTRWLVHAGRSCKKDTESCRNRAKARRRTRARRKPPQRRRTSSRSR